MKIIWLEIALALPDPTDYLAYQKVCIERKERALSMSEYSQKLGMMLVASTMFKDEDKQTAYRQFLQILNNGEAQSDCAGCGKKRNVR